MSSRSYYTGADKVEGGPDAFFETVLEEAYFVSSPNTTYVTINDKHRKESQFIQLNYDENGRVKDLFIAYNKKSEDGLILPSLDKTVTKFTISDENYVEIPIEERYPEVRKSPIDFDILTKDKEDV